MEKLDNMDGTDIIEENKINGDVEDTMEITEESIIGKVKKDGMLNCLNIEERNFIFFPNSSKALCHLFCVL